LAQLRHLSRVTSLGKIGSLSPFLELRRVLAKSCTDSGPNVCPCRTRADAYDGWHESPFLGRAHRADRSFRQAGRFLQCLGLKGTSMRAVQAAALFIGIISLPLVLAALGLWARHWQSQDPLAKTPRILEWGVLLTFAVGVFFVAVYAPGEGFNFTGVIGFALFLGFTAAVRGAYCWAGRHPESRFAKTIATAAGISVVVAIALFFCLAFF
jgi:hypothetical protein